MFAEHEERQPPLGLGPAVSDATPALEIRGLVVEFDTPDGVVRAVDAVSYHVYPGETLAVVGETGSGKSVTVLAALRLLDGGRVVSGSVPFDGGDLLTLSDRRLRRLLGKDLTMIFQNPMSALNPVMTVGAQIIETILVHQPKLGTRAARDRVLELLAMVGVPQPDVRYKQYPHEFSGGMAQRVVIAMAIANRPKVIVADEPTTAVDVTIQAQLLELLETARQQTGAAVILITHDLGVVAEVADRVAVMYAGRIVETGPVGALFHAPGHPYTAGLLSCLPRLDYDVARLIPIPGSPPDLRQVSPGCPFQPRCALSAGRDICKTTRPPMVPTRSGGLSACHFADEMGPWPNAQSEDGTEVTTGVSVSKSGAPSMGTSTTTQPDVPVLRVQNLVKHFPIRSGVFARTTGVVHAVDDVSFELYPGRTLGLVGESGSGKTTTGRALMRLVEPTAGTVLLDDRDVTTSVDRRTLAASVSMVFQDPLASLNPRLSAWANVAEPLRVHRQGPSSERRRRAIELLEQVGLRADQIERVPAEFSGGQRQRIGIARALALSPRVIILDEPASALDVSVQAQVLNLLARIQAEVGVAFLFISHDLSVVRHLCDRVAVMYLGKIVEIGSRDDLYRRPLHPYTQALLSAVPLPDPSVRRKRVILRGDQPSPVNPPSGCRFRTRCPKAQEICATSEPVLSRPSGAQAVACHFPEVVELAG